MGREPLESLRNWGHARAMVTFAGAVTVTKTAKISSASWGKNHGNAPITSSLEVSSPGEAHWCLP